jgi:very-short-patch-repair endonuclease
MKKLDTRKFAGLLRSNQTPAERKLWGALRKRSFAGYRFHRQVAIGPYVADFVCREKALVIEVDGIGHSDAVDIVRDAKRTAYLQSAGFAVHRIDNGEVYENIDGVLHHLLLVLEARASRFRRRTPSALRAPPPAKLREGE